MDKLSQAMRKRNYSKSTYLPLNSSLEMLVFNLWSPKMLRSVPLAGGKE